MSTPIHGLVISNAHPFMLPVNQLTIFLRCNSVLKRRELEMALQEQVPIIVMEGIDALGAAKSSKQLGMHRRYGVSFRS